MTDAAVQAKRQCSFDHCRSNRHITLLMIEWIETYDYALRWLAVISVFTFVGTLIVVPILITRIPADYFAYPERHRTPWADRHPIERAVLVISKNIFGVLLVTLGLAMLVLPGQGILTILIGLILTDFPGKFRFECWLIGHRPVLNAVNRLRVRASRAPLLLEPDD